MRNDAVTVECRHRNRGERIDAERRSEFAKCSDHAIKLRGIEVNRIRSRVTIGLPQQGQHRLVLVSRNQLYARKAERSN